MARRMHEPKEYYWQGKGGSDVTLEKIISEMLGRNLFEGMDNSTMGEPTDMYTLQFDCYNDVTAVEGHSIIHVPHNENHRIMFSIALLKWDDDSTNLVTSITSDTVIDDSLIEEIEEFGFAIYLRKIASNQPYRYDWS